VYTYPNGDVYDGEWVGGSHNGQGKYSYSSSGAVYMGGFKDGKRHGARARADTSTPHLRAPPLVRCSGSAKRTSRCPASGLGWPSDSHPPPG
jgi:hypothetical protein